MTWTDIVTRGKAQYGERFDASELDPKFAPYCGDLSLRVTVEGPWGRRTGWIGKTTGWRPCFLLMARVNCMGSSDTLSTRDTIVSVRKRRSSR